MPTIITDGAASAQGYGFAARTTAATYIEDVFSTYLYKGNSSTQTITNGIDLAGKGGLVWLKYRSGGGNPAGHFLYTPALVGSGNPYYYKHLRTNDTNAAGEGANDLTAFNSTGFSLGGNTEINYSGDNYVSWTFRKQAKFFDLVTYTGNGTAGRTISHSLGSVPGCIIVKCTSTAGTDWTVFHRSINAGRYGFIVLNQTTAAFTSTAYDWNPTSTTFVPQSWLNDNGATYVAYLFAHDAGGFGASGSDNVISCGSYTGNGSATGPVVTLGYEPQFLLIKSSSNGTQNWAIHDNMRGLSYSTGVELRPNTSDPEFTSTSRLINLLPTGFQPKAADDAINQSGGTYIYIAIRRGPMKTPTSGTSVFSPVARAGTGATATVTGIGFVPDLWMDRYRTVGADTVVTDRLRGISPYLATNLTTAESGFGASGNISFDMRGVTIGTGSPFNASGNNYINWFFGRAPGFFDVVCYNGNGTNRTINHNLGVIPELIIVKGRLLTSSWSVYSAALANTERLVLNTTAAKATVTTVWNSTSPTASVFSLGTSTDVNDNYGSGAATYVAYLFATCPGVSKVGSYTGTGTTKQIDCGFTAGARFVLIKRTDSTGDWYVWDSARGIVAGNDPYVVLNSATAEVTGTDYVDTYAAGFEISSTAPAAINANGGSFIFLAIA